MSLERGVSAGINVLNKIGSFARQSLARASQPRPAADAPLNRSSRRSTIRLDTELELDNEGSISLLEDEDIPFQQELDEQALEALECTDSPTLGDTGAADEAGLDPLVAVEMEASGMESPPAAAARAHRHRAKKHGGNNPVVLRTWVKLDASGEPAMIQADKYKIAHELGVQTRDLRLLESHLSSPPAILDREHAIVVNLEYIKCIITLQCVYVVNPEDDRVPALMTELRLRLATNKVPSGGGGGGGGGLGKKKPSYTAALSDVGKNPRLVKSMTGVFIELPFELKALEVCLESITSHLDSQTSDLEAAAYPCLDNLTSRVNTKNLERVRRIKNRMVRLHTRVETIREVLERFLNDDADMHRLNLTAKELSRQASAAEEQLGRQASRRSSSSSGSSSSSSDSEDEAEVAEVEMLLEAYFMHVDQMYNRLETLHEYIKDTEDLVNIKLDQHRNQLITIDLIITAVTTILTCMNVVHGYFGMNLDSGMQLPYETFLEVVVGTCATGVATFLLFLLWCWYMRLIVF